MLSPERKDLSLADCAVDLTKPLFRKYMHMRWQLQKIQQARKQVTIKLSCIDALVLLKSLFIYTD